jgi:hypothetical protein
MDRAAHSPAHLTSPRLAIFCLLFFRVRDKVSVFFFIVKGIVIHIHRSRYSVRIRSTWDWLGNEQKPRTIRPWQRGPGVRGTTTETRDNRHWQSHTIINPGCLPFNTMDDHEEVK